LSKQSIFEGPPLESKWMGSLSCSFISFLKKKKKEKENSCD